MLGPSFSHAANVQPKSISRVKAKAKASMKMEWPEFTVSQPDPELGEIFCGKGALSPEQTLVEFISTSASFHGVKKQPLRTLEFDLLKVFPFNVMPANAAAWYMAKRKFYMNQSFDQQLLPFLLKKYPEKFKVVGTQVVFQEVFTMEVAKEKLKYLVQYGLNAYFSHKADEYGVYFFDPYYYENTEPFHESLRQCVTRPNTSNKSKLVASYFSSCGLKEQFKFLQHSAYSVSICKQPGVKIVTNTTGIIVSMINNQYGFIKFGDAGETALFCCKSLFKDGWLFSGDPLKLPAMKFDGYQISGGGVRGDQAYSWYAVLVWCGRRPSPKFCSTAEDLNSTPVFREGRLQKQSQGGSPVGERRKLRQPSSSMMVGQVTEIRRNGAVLRVREDSHDAVFVPGWKRQLVTTTGTWLSTTSGETIGLGDLVAYYVDTQSTRPGFSAVGKNVMVLKESPEGGVGRRRRRSTERSAGAKYEVGTAAMEKLRSKGNIKNKVEDDSGSETDSEEEVTDGELEWLEKDLGTIIEQEDPQTKTLKLMKDIQVELTRSREKRYGGNNGGIKLLKSGYNKMKSDAEDFWRMRRVFATCIENQQYNSDSDPDYQPGDDIEEVRRPRQSSESGGESASVATGPGSVGRSRLSSATSLATSVGKRSDRVRAEARGKKLPYWVRAISLPEKFDPELEKFVPLDKKYSEERDPDYVLPASDVDEQTGDSSEDEENEGKDEVDEVKLLIEEATKELPEELKEGKHKSLSKVVSPVKVTLTPSKEGPDGEEVDEKILTMESDDEPVRDRPPAMWLKELMLTEQDEDYDSADDPEFVPPPVLFDSEHEYDEYSEDGGRISEDEVESLKKDSETTFIPPEHYIPIWVPVKSPRERIARAKEEVVQVESVVMEDISEKDTDSNGRAIEKSADVKGMELSVDAKAQMKSGDQSSSSAPKPKREHKKSKSTDVEKIGEINSLSDGVIAPSAEKLDIVKKTSQEVTKEVEV